jgi:glucose-1-phosphate thymidylyltransferase
MLGKGIIVVPSTARSTGPWLDATRATSLQRIANRPIICHVLDALQATGVREVAIVMPPDVAEEVAMSVGNEGPAGLEIHPVVHDHDAELADALLAAKDFVGDAPCIVHRSDGLLGQSLTPFAALLQQEFPDVLLLVHHGADQTNKHLRLVTHSRLRISELDWMKATLDIAGACLLGPRALSHAAPNGHASEGLDFIELAKQLIGGGGRVQVRVVREWRQFDGNALDLLGMNRAVLDALETETSARDGDENRFEGRVAIHPTAQVTSSVIVGPVIIGPNARITDSYIGPHTSIGERVRIEGAEIERSIVLADASILHVGGRLVASIVGREARIFRDFSMPRALRLQVGDGDEVALC